MSDGRDPLTKLPVISLYGDKLEPDEDDLADVDAVLFDLPDVGCRCYTYLWTLSKVMKACARHKRPLIVLDRPNPISGLLSLAEGPMLDEEHCSSFIGRWSVPLRHSCTFGELARYWRSTRVRDLELEVIPSEGWRRSMFQPALAGSFVPTSPAITNFEASLLYSGLCMLEATNLSEGRGSPLAFRVAGAPWLDSTAVAQDFNRSGIAGAVARHITFVPDAVKYRGEQCNAVMLHVVNVSVFRPVAAVMALLWLIRERHARHFAWAPYPTHVNPVGAGHLDKILGVPDSERLFDQPYDRFTNSTQSLLDVKEWSDTITSHLLYRE
jgi:uncharacterized protein YbbC (DUF1343 family)